MNLKSVFQNVVKFFSVKKRKGVCAMPYSIFDIAEWFLQKESMTNKKLQKMCYYAQAWYCTLFAGEQLINDEFQAWVHGPVSPSLYRKYSDYGWTDIPPSNRTLAIDSKTEEYLNLIYETFSKFSGDQLEIMTHREDPWLNQRKGFEPDEPCNNVITLDDMRKFYSKLKRDSQLE